MLIFGSPRRYIQGVDARHRLGEELARLGPSAILLADKDVTAIIGDDCAASCAAAGVALRAVTFAGEVTWAEVDRLSALCATDTPAIVVAAGGGKTIDTGKLLSRKLGAKMVTLPTVASNDSPTSHIIVVYDDSHKLIGVERLPTNPELVLVDTAIIARAPSILLSAGIGDAIVKRFEVEQCYNRRGTNMFGGSPPPLTALALARTCYDTIRAHSVAALAAVRRGVPDEALEHVVEASVLMSGLAFESGGLSICHAMTRGLSAVQGPAQALHGLQVAYGLLIQLELEQREPAFIEDMRGFFRATGLPVSLAELGFTGGSNEIGLIADLTAQAPHMKHFERALSADDLVMAIRAVEAQAGSAGAAP